MYLGPAHHLTNPVRQNRHQCGAEVQRAAHRNDDIVIDNDILIVRTASCGVPPPRACAIAKTICRRASAATARTEHWGDGRMRVVMVAVMIALFTTTAFAQGMSKGGRHQGNHQTSEEQKKKSQATDKAYKSALDKIPASEQKRDPWRAAR
jgi:hypothetical protein